MASAEQVPGGSKSNKGIIERFKDDYAAAMTDAHTSAEHTATEGWRRMYSDQRERVKAARRGMAQRLANCARTLEDFGLTEDGEKGVKEIVKESAELREACDAWDRQVVDRVSAAVRRCETMKLEYQNEATRQEANAPLHNVGLEELMRLEIAKHPSPWFDNENGVVVIKDAA